MVDASKVTDGIRKCIERSPIQVEIGMRCPNPQASYFRVRSAQSQSDYLRKKVEDCPPILGRRGLQIQPCVLDSTTASVNPAQTAGIPEAVLVAGASADEYTAAKRRAIELTVSPATRYANVIRGVAPSPQVPEPIQVPLSAMRNPGVPAIPLRGACEDANGVPFRVGVRQPGR